VVGVVVMLHRRALSTAALEGLGSVVDELALAIERSRALSALSLTEDRYRRLVDATVEGICIHDGKRLYDSNPSLAAMLGYEVSEVIGRSPLEFIHPDSLPEVTQRLATNFTGAYEARMVRRDGSDFPIELKGRDFFQDGVKLRVTSVRDLTERKEAERTARKLLEERTARELSDRSRKQAEFLADASRILSSSFDTTTTLNQLAHLSVRFLADFCVVRLYRGGAYDRVAVVHADPAKQPVLDATVELWARRAQGEDPVAFRHRQMKPRVIRLLSEDDRRAIAPEPALRELVNTLAPATVMSVPILINGELIGTILFAAAAPRDPYGPEELAIAEELGRRAAMALESARSYHDAQAATIARDEMLAVVAHDLRNPLSAIIMSSSLALEIGDERKSLERDQFELIKRTGDHMNRLIQDLLDATRMQSGQLNLELLAMPASVIIDDAMEMLLPLATHAGITLEAEVGPDLPPIRADRLRLVQVLSNLMGNALKFTARGGRVGISVTEGEGELRFRVSDTGPGIAPDQLPHIFGRFWQGRRTDGRGLGLGLAIARGIVEAHGGTIWVESEVGVGSSFWFTVPARPDSPGSASDFAVPG
jgi:PAS domain S-box-containing protein